MIPTGLSIVTITRYVTPLREGGSLSGIGEAEDLPPTSTTAGPEA